MEDQPRFRIFVWVHLFFQFHLSTLDLIVDWLCYFFIYFLYDFSLILKINQVILYILEINQVKS